jgi:hypothetical protein
VNDEVVGVPMSLAEIGSAAIAHDNGEVAAIPSADALRKLLRLKNENGLLIFLCIPLISQHRLDQKIAYSLDLRSLCISHVLQIR